MTDFRIHDLGDIGTPADADTLVFDDASDPSGPAKKGTVTNLATRIKALLLGDQTNLTDVATIGNVLDYVPLGGTTGQVLTKLSGGNGDTAWVTPSGGGGSGRTVNTHAHSASGLLSVARAAIDQYTTVTVTADITGFTDNMADGDILRLILKNGTAADYTADLSGLVYLDDQTALPDTIPIYQTTEIALLLEKIEGDVQAISLATKVPGSPQPGAALGFKAAEWWAQSVPTSRTIPGTPSAGDRIILGVVAIGPSGEATTSWTAPTNGNTVNEIVEDNTGTFHPRMKLWETTYDGSTNSFTFGYTGVSSLQSVFILLVDGAGSAVSASTPVLGLDAGTVVSVPDGSLNIAVLGMHDNDKTYSAAPSGYTLGDQNLAEASTFRSGGVAYLVQSGAGTADPGAWTLSATPSFAKAITIVVDS